MHGHPGLVTESLVESAEQGAAAGEDDAAVHDVAGELGRGLVEGGTDGVDDRVERLLERLAESALETTTERGRPEIMSRPRISASGSSCVGKADPGSS